MEKMAVAKCTATSGRSTSRRSGLFLVRCVLRMRTNCYFTASVRRSPTLPLRSINPDFLKERNKLNLAL